MRNRGQTGLGVDGRTQSGLGTVTWLCVTKHDCPKVPPVWAQLLKEELHINSYLFCPVRSNYLEGLMLKGLTF